MNKKKIVTICLLIAAVLLYLVAAQAIELLFDILNWRITRDFFLTIPEMIAVVIAVGAFLVAMFNSTINDYLVESANELSKVTYPTPKESGQSAIIVVVMVAMATLILTVFDSIWSYLTQLVLSN